MDLKTLSEDLKNSTTQMSSSPTTVPPTTSRYSGNSTGGTLDPVLGLLILWWWLVFFILTLKKMTLSGSTGTKNLSEAIRYEHGVYDLENPKMTTAEDGTLGPKKWKATVAKTLRQPTDS
jgi:hypothetical protein